MTGTRHPPGRFLREAECGAWGAELEARRVAVEQAGGWRVQVSRAGLSVEGRSSEAGPCVRGAVELTGDLAELAEVLLLSVEERIAWDPTLDQYELLDQLGERDTLYQIAVRSGAHPFIQDRELVYHERASRGPGWVETLACSRALPQVPPLPGCLRADMALSARSLRALGDGRVRYEALWQLDLGGWLPRWAAGRGQAGAMLKEHLKFRERWPPR